LRCGALNGGANRRLEDIVEQGEFHLESIARIAHHNAMKLNLPESVEARLSPESTALHLAIGLFVSEEATLGQAAEIAGMPQASFLRELGQRRIPIHYGSAELAEDLQAVESLAGR
jgi:predicted HTH domain antitoxin